MGAALTWMRAGRRNRRLASLLLVLASGGVVAALLLAGALLGTAFDPWQRAFQSAGAPDIRLDLISPATGLSDRASLGALAALPGVESVTTPQRTLDTALAGGGPGANRSLPLSLRADTVSVPRPLMLSGRWLHPGETGALVVERSTAEAAWLHPGSTVSILDPGGTRMRLQVVGIADSPDQISFPQAGYGLGWLTGQGLDAINPDPAQQGRTIGLRLHDPRQADQVAARAVATLGTPRVVHVSTWQDARSSWAQDGRLAGTLLGASALLALPAAAWAVAAASSRHVRSRRPDIALLKAMGCTRTQVVVLYTAEHLLLAGTGALVGWLGAAWALEASPALSRAAALQALGPGVTATVTALTVLAVATAAAVPAWHAARQPAVPGHSTPLAQAGSRSTKTSTAGMVMLRLPALGMALTALRRRLPATALLALRCTVPALACILGLSTWATLQALPQAQTTEGRATVTVRLTADPARAGRLIQELQALPATAVYPGAEATAFGRAGSSSFTLRALGTTVHPYPWRVVQGRPIHTPGEAEAGQGLLTLLHVRVGDHVHVTAGAATFDLHIVGRVAIPEQNGRILLTGWDTLAPATTTVPSFYRLVLPPGSDPTATATRAAALPGLTGQVTARPDATASQPLDAVRASVIGLLLLLAVIGLADLLTVAAAIADDLGTEQTLMRAVGVSPAQLQTQLAIRTALPALAGLTLGTAVGIPLSLWMINAEAARGGIGAGIAQPPAPLPLALCTVTVIVIAVFATVGPGAQLRAQSPRSPVHDDELRPPLLQQPA